MSGYLLQNTVCNLVVLDQHPRWSGRNRNEYQYSKSSCARKLWLTLPLWAVSRFTFSTKSMHDLCRPWQIVDKDIMYNGNVWNMAGHWEGERGSRLGIKQMNVQKSGPNECFFHSLSYNHLCPVNSTAWIDCVRINQYHLKSVLKLMGPPNLIQTLHNLLQFSPPSYPDILKTSPHPQSSPQRFARFCDTRTVFIRISAQPRISAHFE